MMSAELEELAVEFMRAVDQIEQLETEICKGREALTPSAETKAAYAGEFAWVVEEFDQDGYPVLTRKYVPWTVIKEIMSAIRERAGLGD